MSQRPAATPVETRPSAHWRKGGRGPALPRGRAGMRPPTLLGVEHEAHAGAPAPNRSSYFLPVVSELARSVCRRWICKQQVRTHQDVRIGTRTRPRIRPRAGTARRPGPPSSEEAAAHAGPASRGRRCVLGAWCTLEPRQEGGVPAGPPATTQASSCARSGQKGTHLLIVGLHGNPHLLQVRGLYVGLQFAKNPSSELTRQCQHSRGGDGDVSPAHHSRAGRGRLGWPSAGWWPRTDSLPD